MSGSYYTEICLLPPRTLLFLLKNFKLIVFLKSFSGLERKSVGSRRRPVEPETVKIRLKDLRLGIREVTWWRCSVPVAGTPGNTRCCLSVNALSLLSDCDAPLKDLCGAASADHGLTDC